MYKRQVLIAGVALVAGSATPASASLGDEVRAGRSLAERIQAGQTSCDRLADEDFAQLGEFVMSRMTGAAQLQGLDERMRSVMGEAGERRMHVLMGRRSAGCPRGDAIGPMGPGMMGGDGWDDAATWDRMAGSPMWSWMRDGAWQRMSRADWQRVGDRWMGAGMIRAGDDGWDVGDVALVAIVVALAAGLLGGLLASRRPTPWQWWRVRR